MAKSNTTTLGACGEYYVAAYLSHFHLIVALPRAGVPGCDLFVANEKSGPAIRVQVKTGGPRSKKQHKQLGEIYLWWTSFTAIEKNDKNLWYAYVWTNKWLQRDSDTQPEVFFVPSAVVAKTMAEEKAAGEMGFFWMKVADAQKYKGKAGVKSIRIALGQTPTGEE